MSSKLGFEELLAAAAAVGVKPRFGASDYVDRYQELPWECAKNPAHKFSKSFADVARRGCGQCKLDVAKQKRRAEEFAMVCKQMSERGDRLLSVLAEYRTQKSQMRYVCSRCGQESAQMASKVKLGQLHVCTGRDAANKRARDQYYERLVSDMAAEGITITTTRDEYEVDSQYVRYRIDGSHELLTKSVENLRHQVRRRE